MTRKAEIDFETYSEAGYVWDEAATRWRMPPGCSTYGLKVVGLAVYAEHPSTEVVCLAYDLGDGKGCRLWVPGMPPPADLLAHIEEGGLIEAHNAGFEWAIWRYICEARWGWPHIPLAQLRCTQARSQAYALPGSLGGVAEVLGTKAKNPEGERLIKLLSCPRQPSAKDPRRRVRVEDAPEEASRFYVYCRDDVGAEHAISEVIPELPPEELAFWRSTVAMNARGMAIDAAGVRACIRVLDEAYRQAEAALPQITGGVVRASSEVARISAWMAARGVHTKSLDAAALEALLAAPLPMDVRQVLEIRQATGSAGVKKVYAMARMADSRGRLCHMFIYHGARTGRDTGKDIQPQNLVKHGPRLRWCENADCLQPYGTHALNCPHCGTPAAMSHEEPWSYEAVDAALRAIGRGFTEALRVFGDPVLLVSGCIRGLFIAGPGMDLIASDYASIEAVVTAVLAGEEWRIEAFRRKEDIYLVSAGRMMGRTLEWYMANGGKKHPDRQDLGKPSELGLGFGGWIRAWRQFDDSDRFTDDEVRDNIKAWRAASPAIVELWGGQFRGPPFRIERWELYGLEGAIIRALQNPNTWQDYRLIGYYHCTRADVLYCLLPSGRHLSYHRPRLSPSTDRPGTLTITYEGYNSNPKAGAMGWIRRELYGGSATENVVQAVARDFMRDGALRVEAAGYPVVMRTHDELVAEVREGFGSVEEFEALMGVCPPWAEGWPIRAAGGYRAKRYRKD